MPLETITTPLFQKNGDIIKQILPETTAGQVKTADGSNVETKLAGLSSAVSGQTHTYVVADIAARDALTGMLVGDQAWVKDASADSTVTSGSAKYIYESADVGWVKAAEDESMDVVINWADVRGTEAVTAAVAKAHEHANKADVLDKLSIADGVLAYNGKAVGGKYGAYVTVGPDDPGFDAAVAALNLPDGAFFTVITEA